MGLHDIKCLICGETLDMHSKTDALECLKMMITENEKLNNVMEHVVFTNTAYEPKPKRKWKL